MKKRVLGLLMTLCVAINLITAIPITANASSTGDYVTVNLYMKRTFLIRSGTLRLEFDPEKVEVDSWNSYGGLFTDKYASKGYVPWKHDSEEEEIIKANQTFLSVKFKILSGTPKFSIGKALFYDTTDKHLIQEDEINKYVGIETVFGEYAPLVSIELNPEYLDLKQGDIYRLQAVCTPSNAKNKMLSWSSDNTYVATVDANGVVTAHNVGVANITARSQNGKSATVIVSVLSMPDYYFYFGYQFGNSYDNFYGDVKGYKIPYVRYRQVGFKPITAKIMSTTKWGGNCFGMSSSSILFWKNVLKEEHYDENVSLPFYLPYPKNNEKLRNMIEVLQVSQFIEGYDNQDFFSNIEIIKKQLDEGNPVMLKLKGIKTSDNSVGYHAVVITGYEKTGQLYKFKIYDCSYFVNELLFVNNDEWVFDYNDASYTFTPEAFYTYDKIYEVYNAIRQYNYNDSITFFELDNNKSDYTYIFRTVDNLIITNYLGQTSLICDGKVSGDISDIRIIPSSYLAEEPTYTLILPTDTYTIVGSSDEEITTSFADDYMSASVTAKSSTPITISSDLKEINIDTSANDEYSINYTTYDNVFDEMTLTGTATGAVTSRLDESNVLISGVDTLTASASVSESVVSTNSDGLADADEVTVRCEEGDVSATIQILSTDTVLTEKTSLPERLTAIAPVYDLESGTYTESQVLTFTKDDDTIIYYTTDGSIPSADNGIIYSLPIDINKSMTVKAISTKYGYSDSEIVELNYVLPEVDMPQASVESGEYDRIITVELSTGNFDDEIYYTIDGSNPHEEGILYTVPIHISEDAYLQAYTLRNGCISEISEYDYVVSPSYPFYFSNLLTNQDDEIITPDNIGDITEIKMTLSKLHSGEHSGVFLIAFYDADERLLYTNYKTSTISKDTDEVVIEVTGDIASAHTIKAYAWNNLSNMKSICGVLEEKIVID